MKGKDIMQWVFSRTKSLAGSQGVARANSSQGAPQRSRMDIDAICSPMPDERVPQKESFNARGTTFRIDTRFSFIKVLGLGAYGVVCAAKDEQNNIKVAVKKVAGVFEDLTDAKRIIREVRLMHALRHPNILQILDIDEPESYEGFEDVYIVTELMDTDLHKVLRSRHALLDDHKKFFTYQIFRAMKYLHSANILHRDLKPANILVAETCDIKICDFGLARYIGAPDESKNEMTEYVVTRWYRAPELLLAAAEYTAAIDMWSIGCLIAELYCRRPIFPGSDVKNQIQVICSLLGKPTDEEIKGIKNLRARDFVSKIPASPRKSMSALMPESCPAAQDLVDRLLQFDPEKRLSAEEALAHPYVAEYRDPDSETTATTQQNVLEPPSEKDLGKHGIRRLMWDEILKFHPEARAREPPLAVYADGIVKRVESSRY